MENQFRYTLGDRQDDGRYMVTVDNTIEAGYVYRRHGSWYGVMPGQTEARRPDRFQAAYHLVRLTDAGHRPTPQKAGLPLTSEARDLLISPHLRLTAPNIVRASEAIARLGELGWRPLTGYPGADQSWRMACLLGCGWEGTRFWSHLRGRNGDPTPRPLCRHRGCVPQSEHAAKLAAITQASECPCEFKHVTTAVEAITHLPLALSAQANAWYNAADTHLARLLGPCPAASVRAVALRTALDRIL
ncbi:hypothetical protein [Streptomyces sp. NPDC047065]|uniref:hypothetical protein n=1 Tax=Streptomyces sp. NPDC047065 TaxID=3154606 RepID=UPI0033FBA52F